MKENAGIDLTCDHCQKKFMYEFLTPIAVRCEHCESIFDARLQLVKMMKVESDAGE